MRSLVYILLAGLVLLVAGCRQVTVPDVYEEAEQICAIYPDYRDVTIPVNIAPLHFEWTDSVDEVVSRFLADGEELVVKGRKVCLPEDEWQRLVERGVNKAIQVDMYVQHRGHWKHYRPFNIYVSPDSIDPWLTYRLIAPSYVVYDELILEQRCLENYETRLIYNNMLCGTSEKGQCVNCHHSQWGNPQYTLFHARQFMGGTLFNFGGQLKKIDLKTDSTISAGVYPAWHPKESRLVAFSVNSTKQSFLTRHIDKVEVFDTMSDLILYDIERNQICIVANDPKELETFPCWSPDGRWLYYSSAHFERQNERIDLETELALRYRDIHYNIYRKSFDPATGTFGERKLVYDAEVLGMSATLPRISPNGKWLLMAVGPYGTFHVWHHEADLRMMNLETGECNELSVVNSPEAESYHTWSSNGRWIVFSSRRNDGNYTRPFFAHIDADGVATKPFELPQEAPDYHRQLLKSYNVPEFLQGPVKISPQEFAKTLRTEAGKTIGNWRF